MIARSNIETTATATTTITITEAAMNNNSDSCYFYEKEAEYYGFTPFQLLDSIGEFVVKAAFGVFQRLNNANLPSKYSFLSMSAREASFSQWTMFVEQQFGKNYELFESYVIKNILMLPDSFNLPNRRRSLLDYLEENQNDEKISLVKEHGVDVISSQLQRYERGLKMNNHLDEEENFIEETLIKLEQMEGDYQFLKERIESLNLPNPEVMTSALVRDLEALKKIVATTSEYSSTIATLEAEVPEQQQQQQQQSMSTEESLRLEYDKIVSIASLQALKTFF